MNNVSSGGGRSLAASLPLAGAVFLLFGLWPALGGDLFMHLTVGRWTWQHAWPPMVDVFSYLTPNAPFIAHSWLAGLLFYGLHETVGLVGFAALRLALISVALVCLWRTATLLTASQAAMLLLTPVVLAILWGRLEFRPQLFTTALLAGQLWLLISVHTGERSWRWLWVLPPVYIFWVNTHAGWVQGIAMLVVIGLALVAMDVRRRWLAQLRSNLNKTRKMRSGNSSQAFPTSQLPLRHLALVLVACGCALFLNPYGSRLLVFPFEMQADWIRDNGGEWQSPWGNPVWGEVSGGKVVGLEPVFWAYLVAAVGVLLVSLRRWRTVDLVPLACLAFWLALALRHLRAVSDAVLLTSPFLSAFLAAALPSWRTWPVVVGSGLTIGVAACSIPHTLNHGFRINGWKLSCAARMLERLSGRVFAYGLDAWVLYQFHPQVTVPATWEFVAGPRVWAEYDAAWRDLPAYLARHRVDVVLLHRSPTLDFDGWLFVPTLVAHGWVIVHLDYYTTLLVPQRPDTTGLIAREGYHWGLKEPTTPDETAQLLAEASRALRVCPSNAGFAWWYKADALRRLGSHAEAEAADRHFAAWAKARGIPIGEADVPNGGHPRGPHEMSP